MYYSCGISVIIILLIGILWKTQKIKKCYAHLPTQQFLVFKVIYKYLTNKLNSRSLTTSMFQILEEVSKQFEKEAMFYIWCFRSVLVVFGEDAVKTFATNEACADKSPEYDLMKYALGEGLITSNGETWKNDRKMLNPIFHTQVLKNMVPILNENASILVTKLAEETDKPSAKLLQNLHYCTFHNLCESILEINMKETMNEIEIEDFFELMSKLEEYATTAWLFPTWSLTLVKFCTPFGWKSMKYLQKIKQFQEKLWFRMKESPSSKSTASRNDASWNRKSIHPILIGNPSFTIKYVQDHVVTFATAGTDSVSSTTMWCLFLLGLHKDVQQRAFDEIRSVANEFITYEDLFQLEYLESIIKETLRLYPTVPVLARYLKKYLQCGEYNVPKDTHIVFYLYGLHRNAEIYPDPEHFNPDRFRSGTAEKRNWAHLPFSEGYRSCIGKRFAMMQMKVILAYVLRNYEIISLDSQEDTELTWKIFLQPTRPLRMRLTLRKESNEAFCKNEE